MSSLFFLALFISFFVFGSLIISCFQKKVYQEIVNAIFEKCMLVIESWAKKLCEKIYLACERNFCIEINKWWNACSSHFFFVKNCTFEWHWTFSRNGCIFLNDKDCMQFFLKIYIYLSFPWVVPQMVLRMANVFINILATNNLPYVQRCGKLHISNEILRKGLKIVNNRMR